MEKIHLRIVRTLDISAEEFFANLAQSIVLSAQRDPNRSRELTLEEIKPGLSLRQYTRDGRDAGTTLIIKEYEYGRKYYARTKASADTVDIDITAQPLEGGRCEVTYFQHMDRSMLPKRKGLLYHFSELYFLSRMSSRLYDIQAAVRREKGEIPPAPKYNPIALQIYHNIQEKRKAQKAAQLQGQPAGEESGAEQQEPAQK